MPLPLRFREMAEEGTKKYVRAGIWNQSLWNSIPKSAHSHCDSELIKAAGYLLWALPGLTLSVICHESGRSS